MSGGGEKGGFGRPARRAPQRCRPGIGAPGPLPDPGRVSAPPRAGSVRPALTCGRLPSAAAGAIRGAGPGPAAPPPLSARPGWVWERVCVCGAAAAGLRGRKMEGCGAERRAGASPLSSLFFLILFSSSQGPSGRSWPASVGSGLLGLIAVRRAVAPGCRYRGRPSDRDMCCCVRQGWGTAWGCAGCQAPHAMVFQRAGEVRSAGSALQQIGSCFGEQANRCCLFDSSSVWHVAFLAAGAGKPITYVYLKAR